jgi:hypothetical protein
MTLRAITRQKITCFSKYIIHPPRPLDFIVLHDRVGIQKKAPRVWYKKCKTSKCFAKFLLDAKKAIRDAIDRLGALLEQESSSFLGHGPGAPNLRRSIPKSPVG